MTTMPLRRQGRMWASSLIFIKLIKVSNRLKGEKSPKSRPFHTRRFLIKIIPFFSPLCRQLSIKNWKTIFGFSASDTFRT
jgi:hypothetical protein